MGDSTLSHEALMRFEEVEARLDALEKPGSDKPKPGEVELEETKSESFLEEEEQ